jgi:7-keto-8-aminopelargonate synthetase-like enzyme
MMAQIDNEKLRSSLLSYTFAQENLDENLSELQTFLIATGLGPIDISKLKEKLNCIKKEEEKLKHDQKRIAKLFTRSKQVRRYQFGSSFCPSCHMYKNYEKECPYCKYLEMTL